LRTLIFGFDGLRPDLVTKDIMPRLSSFLEENVLCADNRSVYPTETYVSHPSIFSGFLPERHGIPANAYFDPAVSREKYFVGFSVDRIEEAEEATGGALFLVPTLTEVMAERGLSYIALSSNTAGSARLMAHAAGRNGGVCISVNGIDRAIPEGMRSRFRGPSSGDPFQKPDLAGMGRVNDFFRELVESEGFPDLGVLWYGEPDNSFHAYGIGSDESLRALGCADSRFGEILDLYGGTDELNVIVASDHGHIAVRETFDLKAALEAQGFSVGDSLAAEDADLVLLWGYSGNIYVRRRELMPSIAQALRAMPEMGMLFTADRDGVRGIVPGTFSTRLVGGDSHRGGDIRFILGNDPEPDGHGYAGTCVSDGPVAPGCSTHGGLSPVETRCLLGFGGPAFRKATRIEGPTGVIDISPTIYRILGIEPSILPQGRAIVEALASESGRGPEIERRSFEASSGEYGQRLEIDYIGSIPYIDSGRRI